MGEKQKQKKQDVNFEENAIINDKGIKKKNCMN